MTRCSMNMSSLWPTQKMKNTEGDQSMTADINSLLLQMLTARTGVSPEVLKQELIPQLAGADTDSRMNLLLNYLTQRQAEQQESTLEQENLEAEPNSFESTAIQHAQNKNESKVYRKIEEMKFELEVLRQRNDMLAVALGACYLCWGSDPECAHCSGNGRPGATMPDTRYFRELIVPAVRRWQQRKQKDFPAEKQFPPGENKQPT